MNKTKVKPQPKPLTTEQAIFRARLMISSGQKLTQAAKAEADSRTAADQDAAEVLKNAELLNFRVGTVPEALQPVLEALIEAVSTTGGNTQDRTIQ